MSDEMKSYNDDSINNSRDDLIKDDTIRDEAINNNLSENDSYNNDKVDSAKEENNRSIPSSYSFWAEQIASYTNNPPKEVDFNKVEANGPIDASYKDMDIKVNEAKEEIKKKPSLFINFVKGLVYAAVFGIVAGATFIGVNTIYYSNKPNAAPFSIHIGANFRTNNDERFNFIVPYTEKKLSQTTVSSGKIEQRTDITDVVDKTMPSIVTITSTFTQNYNWFGGQGSEDYDGGGSGIIVGKNDTELLIATNNHVVEGAKTITVSFIDESKATAIIKGTDSIADLAVISIKLSDISKESLEKIKIASLGDSEDVKVGQMAIAIGNALGYGQSTTVGYISAKDREVAISDKTMVLLQTDAAINPGNSGGALLNLKGEVIGINTVKYASSEVEGMGFAIPISRAMPIINELMNREILTEEEKGYLGVYIDDVTSDIAEFYNWPLGVYIKSVIEGGAAEKAGIVSGDIIVGVNTTEITSSDQLKEKVNSYRYGTKVKLKVMRNVNGNYEEQEIIVELGKSSSLPNE